MGFALAARWLHNLEIVAKGTAKLINGQGEQTKVTPKINSE